MELIFLISSFLGPNLGFLGFLFTKTGRELEGREFLLPACLLSLGAGAFAIPSVANPTLRLLLVLPLALAYLMIGVVATGYARDRAPGRSFALLGVLVVGTTSILIFVWTWTDSCAMGVCV